MRRICYIALFSYYIITNQRDKYIARYSFAVPNTILLGIPKTFKQKKIKITL